MTEQKQRQAVKYLCSMIYNGVKDKDKDCVRSHLEDLQGFLIENNLIGD